MKKKVQIVMTIQVFLCCNFLFAQNNSGFKKKIRFSSSKASTSVNQIDILIRNNLKKMRIKYAGPCSDEVFVRRVFIDVLGILPDSKELRAYFNQKGSNKRALLIDNLLNRPEFADYWSLKWCDILRVKSEFPINLWPNAVQAYQHWIRASIAENMPYDKFVRAMLCSSGSNFRVAPVNFYRAVQGHEPSALARAAALSFMGTRLDKWPESKRVQMEKFFSRVAFKGTAEWKEEIVYLNPEPAKDLHAVFPDGKKVTIHAAQDARAVFANWLISPDNPWFARAVVNRIWAWLFGRGIIHEPDDIRDDNPPVHPMVLDYLEKELVKSNYNLRHIYRLILNSQTYQQSCVPATDNKDASKVFACYMVRRLDAEVLIDALCKITGTRESYSSAIPEPFTFVPEEHRSVELYDASITSQFLEMFGRPARDTGFFAERNNKPTSAQRLYLLNSSHIQNKITRSPRIKGIIRSAKKNRNQLIRRIYLHILCRYPDQNEMEYVRKYFRTSRLNQTQAVADLVWALINTKEFLYRH